MEVTDPTGGPTQILFPWGQIVEKITGESTGQLTIHIIGNDPESPRPDQNELFCALYIQLASENIKIEAYL